MSGAVGRYAWIGALVLGTVCLPGVGAQIPNSAYPPITLSGMQLILYKTGHINNGWAAYYSTDPQHADTATDSLVIDHLDGHDRQGRSLGPAQFARAMVNQVKSRGGTVISPFAVPDKAHPGQYTYFASFYYIYRERGLGDIWMSHIFFNGAGTVGILYRHTIHGTDPTTLEGDVRRWMAMNLQSYGTAVGALAVPAQPSEPPKDAP